MLNSTHHSQEVYLLASARGGGTGESGRDGVDVLLRVDLALVRVTQLPLSLASSSCPLSPLLPASAGKRRVRGRERDAAGAAAVVVLVSGSHAFVVVIAYVTKKIE